MLVEVPCELDADGVRTCRALIATWAQSPGDLILDLKAVTRLDSSGLGLLVMAQKRKLEQGREFAIQNVAGQPLALLEQFKLLDVFGCITSADSARPIGQPATA